MKTLDPVIRITLSLLLIIGCAQAEAGSGTKAAARTKTAARTSPKPSSIQSQSSLLARTAVDIYRQMNLEAEGLNEQAFEYAYIGHEKLRKRHLLHKSSVLSICDFSQPSSEQRMYVIDIAARRLLYRTYVAHGMNSGTDYASSFSNRCNSYKSSIGFYITSQSYYGDNGLSLRIRGMDRGFNDMAGKRNIVIHGAPYVSTRILQKYGVMGTTFGCPAIPDEMTSKIIPVIKKGTCFFIYYPSQRYLSGSSVLNS